MANSAVEKNEFKKAVEKKKHEKRILKEYIATKFEPNNNDIVANLKSGLDFSEFIAEPKVSKISNTKMDEAVKKGKVAVKPKYKTEAPQPKKLFLTESEKRRALG